MINILVDKPQKLATNVLVKYSAFVKFDYDSELVRYMQGLPARAYHPQTKQWEIPTSQLAKFCDTFTGYDIEIICNIPEDEKEETLKDIPKDYIFKTKPFKHQLDGIRFALTKERFLLCDDQGLGKTKQIIDWVGALGNEINKCLIICGVNSLKYNWVSEIETHSNEKAWVIGTRFRKNGKQYEGSSKDKLEDLNNLPNCKFIITNIETLRAGAYKENNRYKFPMAEKISELCKKGIISAIAFDECHKSKNPTSLQGRAMLKTTAKYLAAMSGTPLMNNPLDLYFPLKWLGYENHSFYQFKQHYCLMGGFNGSEVVVYKNLEEIRQILDIIMLRRLKGEVLDLPEKISKIEYVEMTKKQSSIYNEVLQDVRNEISRKIDFANNPLSMLTRLRQATGYTGILSDTVKESAKLDRMEEIVEELVESGQKCIIFSNWESITSEVKNRLNHLNPAYITGSTNATDRMNEVNRFQENDNCKVIIGTIGAMGTGLTLTAAQNVIFLDEPWNRALKDQAEDRAHRIGTKGVVNIITIICKDTIDERINQLVYKKGVLSDIIVDGTQKIDMNVINQLLS